MFLLFFIDNYLPPKLYLGKSSVLTLKRRHETMDANFRELLTVEQAAEYLQLSQSSIRSYIRHGKLNAFRIAGKRKVLIPREEILKLLEPARLDQPPKIEPA